MKKIIKTIKSYKKSIISFMLAIMLTLTFNYSPLMLLASSISTAYKATTKSEYYATSNTGEEKNISSDYPKELEKYFTGSKSNYNIKTDFYDPEYLSTYGYYIHKYLTDFKAGGTDTTFADRYTSFLTKNGYSDILAYYEAKKATLSATSFYDFIESFVSVEQTVFEQETSPIFPSTDANYKSKFYCSLANYLINEQLYTDDNDGVSEGDNFYEKSASYKAVKDYIDGILLQTLAIYGYDGKTQNKYVASILASGAPVTSEYAYDTTTKYEYKTVPRATYVTSKNKYSGNTLINVYVFGDETNVPKSIKEEANKFTYVNEPLSTRDNSILTFREIQFGEDGYINDSIKSYYKYNITSSSSSKPYVQTLSTYNNIYVLDKNITEDKTATYTSLNFTIISEEELTANSNLYVQIPYYSDDLAYFDAIINDNILSVIGSQKDKFYNMFTKEDGYGIRTSMLYFKLNTTNQNYIYYDPDTVGNVSELLAGYKYKDQLVEVDNLPANSDDYELITSSTYTESGKYVLYYKKRIIEYGETVSTYTGEYVKKTVPNIPLEQKEIPSEFYELDSTVKKIFVLGDSNFTAKNGIVCYALPESTLNEAIANLYIKVPANIQAELNKDEAEPKEFYYMHKTKTVDAIYVLDDKNTNSEVYKNLHYTVITNDDYLSADMSKNYTNYLAIQESDPNYNKNLKLYYKYKTTIDQSEIYVQNTLTGMNARYIVDNGIDVDEYPIYTSKGLTVIKKTEFDAHPEFYKQIDENDTDYYDPQSTSLYFKYKSVETSENQIYYYSTKTSSLYETFSSADTDYDANDYVLLKPTDSGYVEGTDLYYKKIKSGTTFNAEPINTTFSYKTTTTGTKAKLEKNSYFVVSFYLYTNGYYDTTDVTQEGTIPIEASVYITDSNNKMKEIALEGLSTNGQWKQYFTFLATNELSDSSFVISMYMGNKNSILGSQINSSYTTVTGNILFDNIQVYKINETDFIKLSINDNLVQNPEKPVKNGDTPVPGTFADEFNNEIFVTNTMTKFENNEFDARTQTKVSLYDANMFNFDNLSTTFEGLSFISGTNGYSEYTNSWQYYISRADSDPGKTTTLKKYQDAYTNNKLTASIVDEESFFDDKVANETRAKEDKESSDSSDNDESDKLYIKSTFEKSNKVLKLQNTDTFLTLGITSNNFTIKQFQYYKLTVWIYSTDEDAQATLTVNSVYKTPASLVYGTLMTSSATVDANYFDYSSTPTNEYGWIPISFYISGNALHDQDCTLVLSASENSTIYFDKITIQNTTSDAYKTASSDSDKTTYCLSLTNSDSVLANGVTNGYFNNVNVTTDYNNYDYSLPKVAQNWTVVSTNSTGVVAGVVPTSAEYTALTGQGIQTFYDKYNNGLTVSNTYGTNIYAIHAPSTKLDSLTNKEYATTSKYTFYTSSLSLSSSTVYKIEFDFYYSAGQFDGIMQANLYAGSVATDKLLSNFELAEETLTPNAWNTFSFYVQTGTSSTTVYLELGVKNAVGTCFFQRAINAKQSKTLDAIRDNLMEKADVDLSDGKTPVADSVLKNARFVNLNKVQSSIISNQKNDYDLYNSKEFKSDINNTATYTVGKTSVAVASYYTSSDEYSYTVTINKVEYYLAPAIDENGDEILDKDGNKVYKLYSDSNHTEEVTEIDGKPVTVNGAKSVSVGTGKSSTETNTTETKKTNYIYNFDQDIEINNVFIPASELRNAQSQNVLILANSYNTDYTIQTPIYSNSLSTTSYYVLKIYVKTSDFESDDFGLTIDIPSISTKWENINTTKVSTDNVQVVENGFVCYQVLITTNTSSIANLSVTFSLGTSSNTGSGYAIISGVEFEKFATEKLFNEYAESDKVSDDELVMKKYFGTVKEDKKETETKEEKEDEESVGWATFFYIFSSLLLVLAMIVAFVGIFLKKHPIKVVTIARNDHERNSSSITPAKYNSKDVIEVTKPSRKSKSVKQKTNDDTDTPASNSDEGFI